MVLAVTGTMPTSVRVPAISCRNFRCRRPATTGLSIFCWGLNRLIDLLILIKMQDSKIQSHRKIIHDISKIFMYQFVPLKIRCDALLLVVTSSYMLLLLTYSLALYTIIEFIYVYYLIRQWYSFNNSITVNKQHS